MPTGMELYNRDGTVMFTMTDRLFKVVGSVFINAGDNGTVTVSEWNDSKNVPAWITRAPDNSNGSSTYVPNISISGTTLTFSTQTIRGQAPPRGLWLDYGYF